MVCLLSLEIANPGKLIREQTSSTYQTTINITLGHQSIDTLGSDTSTILNSDRLCYFIVVHFGKYRSDVFVYLVGRVSIADQSSSEDILFITCIVLLARSQNTGTENGKFKCVVCVRSYLPEQSYSKIPKCTLHAIPTQI